MSDIVLILKIVVDIYSESSIYELTSTTQFDEKDIKVESDAIESLNAFGKTFSILGENKKV
jgi:hypothetical protein